MHANRHTWLAPVLLSCAALACSWSERAIANLGGPQGGADAVGTLASDAPGVVQPPTPPAEGLWDAASCDAVAFVSVRIGEMDVYEADQACFQNVVITNSHESSGVVVLGHHPLASQIPGSPRLVGPQSEESDIWSCSSPACGGYTVDWYAAVLAVPECGWLYDDQQYDSGYAQIPGLGLVTVPIVVPSCGQ